MSPTCGVRRAPYRLTDQPEDLINARDWNAGRSSEEPYELPIDDYVEHVAFVRCDECGRRAELRYRLTTEQMVYAVAAPAAFARLVRERREELRIHAARESWRYLTRGAIECGLCAEKNHIGCPEEGRPR